MAVIDVFRSRNSNRVRIVTDHKIQSAVSGGWLVLKFPIGCWVAGHRGALDTSGTPSLILDDESWRPSTSAAWDPPVRGIQLSGAVQIEVGGVNLQGTSLPTHLLLFTVVLDVLDVLDKQFTSLGICPPIESFPTRLVTKPFSVPNSTRAAVARCV
jgi:hypothetical protein